MMPSILAGAGDFSGGPRDSVPLSIFVWATVTIFFALVALLPRANAEAYTAAPKVLLSIATAAFGVTAWLTYRFIREL